MANTTFSGPIRSESTIKTVSKNATTGAITEVSTFGDGPVSLSDGDVTLTNATHTAEESYLFQTEVKIIHTLFQLQ